MEPLVSEEFLQTAIQRLQLLANSPYRSSLPTQSQVPADSPLRQYLPLDPEPSTEPLEDSGTKNEDTTTSERAIDRSLILLALTSNGPEFQRGLASLSPSYQEEITYEDTPESTDPKSLFNALDISKCAGYCKKRDAASNDKWIVIKTSQMANAAATGCQGCALLKRCCETILGFEFDVDPVLLATESQESEASDEPYLPILISGKFYFKKGGLKKVVEDVDKLHVGEKRIYFRLEPTIQFSVGGENEVEFKSITMKQVWELFSSRSSSSKYYQIKEPGMTSGNTNSEQAMSVAKEWLNSCISLHENCAKVVIQGAIQPRRLLDISPRQMDNKILLKESIDILDGALNSYACLSHCWGSGTMPVKTTKSTVEDHMRGINLDTLPQTFKDAVRVTRKLGIKYLWIDTLCIVQDDEEDWNTEAAKMASIYSNAQLTLAAASATDAHGGLFFEAPDPAIRIESTGVKLLDDMDLCVRPVLPHFTRTQSGNGNLDEFPVLTRGWVFQERLLSRRILYFSKCELMWECMDKTYCECGSLTGAYTSSENGTIISKTTFTDSWHRIIEAYTSLKLTYQVDKLPALSGIAQVFSKNNPDSVYAGGFWSEALPDGLQWSVSDTEELKVRSEQHAPTWSWASVPNRVVFRDETRKEKEKDHPYLSSGGLIVVQPLDLEPVPKGSNKYGHFIYCHLRVKCSIAPGIIIRNSSVISIRNELKPFQVTSNEEDRMTFHADFDITLDPHFEFFDLDDTTQACKNPITVAPLAIWMYRHDLYNPMFPAAPFQFHKRFVYLVLEKVMYVSNEAPVTVYRRLGLAFGKFAPLANPLQSSSERGWTIQMGNSHFDERALTEGCGAMKTPAQEIILV